MTVLAAALAVGSGLATVATASGATSPPVATVRATPDNSMVNSTVTVVGKGFARHATVTLVECPVASWVVVADPCDTTNSVTVRTNGRGSFHLPFVVHVCPGGASGGQVGPSFLCYLGVARPSGVDTVALQPSTTIVVTYP
jgi:hypothetical protein